MKQLRNGIKHIRNKHQVSDHKKGGGDVTGSCGAGRVDVATKESSK